MNSLEKIRDENGSDDAGLRSSDRQKRRGVFAYSNWDLLLVLFTCGQVGQIIAFAKYFDDFSWLGLTGAAILNVALIVTQFHVVTHQFIHTRFFNSSSLNFLYSIVCSIPVLSSFTEQAIEHLNHHAYVNDPADPATGTTKDPASTYRYGENGAHEAILRYALLSPIRQFMEAPDYSGRRQKVRRQARTEVTCYSIFWVLLLFYNWKFAAFYLCLVYCGLAITSAQNYFEHYGAIPNDRKTDSVSCYGSLYNWFWINNGYHQEHHHRPGVHWTKMAELRKAMLPEDQRRVVPWAHFMNFPGSPFASKRTST